MTLAPRDSLAGLLPGPVVATRDFDRGDTLTLFTEVYENGRSPEHTVDLSAELRTDDGRVVVRTTEQRSSRELQGTRGGYGFRASLPLADVQPGTYIVHVEARPVLTRDILIRVR